MAEYASALVFGIGSVITAVLGGYALVVKARAGASEPRRLLQRMWDWLEGAGLAVQVPPMLARDVQRALNGKEEAGDDVTSG